MNVNKLENSTYFTYGSLEPHSAQPENSFQSEEFQMQKIIPYKALQMYRELHHLEGEKKCFSFVSHASTSLGEFIPS